MSSVAGVIDIEEKGGRGERGGGMNASLCVGGSVKGKEWICGEGNENTCMLPWCVCKCVYRGLFYRNERKVGKGGGSGELLVCYITTVV